MKVQYVRVDSLKTSESLRTDEEVQSMIVTLRKAGNYRILPQITVCKEEDGYLVLDGNCRVKALRWFQNNEIGTFKKLCFEGHILVRIIGTPTVY